MVIIAPLSLALLAAAKKQHDMHLQSGWRTQARACLPTHTQNRSPPTACAHSLGEEGEIGSSVPCVINCHIGSFRLDWFKSGGIRYSHHYGQTRVAV